MIQHVYRKTVKLVRHVYPRGLAAYKDSVQTIIYDNGREFVDHEGMAKDLDAKIYFAHPYASLERGLNKNTNCLLRQYFSKNRNLAIVTEAEMEHPLNHRPRNLLEFKASYEVFSKQRHC